MKPVRRGDRGPAVEDIQRRLLALGYDLGPTGVDGVFFGATEVAVRAFQAEQQLVEDGYVGPQTWSSLVDATYRLGDRMLYLRLPHFHGRDVRLLQEALNALGFACGLPDGIFGAFSERAVREFQRNSGLPADGIAGPETVRALMALRHVWEGKSHAPHSKARLEPARAAGVLSRVSFAVSGLDAAGERVAGRLVNLALAAEPGARVALVAPGVVAHPDADAVFHLCGEGHAESRPGEPVVNALPYETFANRLVTALAFSRCDTAPVVVDLEIGHREDERAEQRAAVLLLDAICSAFD